MLIRTSWQGILQVEHLRQMTLVAVPDYERLESDMACVAAMPGQNVPLGDAREEYINPLQLLPDPHAHLIVQPDLSWSQGLACAPRCWLEPFRRVLSIVDAAPCFTVGTVTGCLRLCHIRHSYIKYYLARLLRTSSSSLSSQLSLARSALIRQGTAPLWVGQQLLAASLHRDDY